MVPESGVELGVITLSKSVCQSLDQSHQTRTDLSEKTTQIVDNEPAYLNPPTLMMNIMKRRILLITPLQNIPRQAIPTMIIYPLHHTNSTEAHRLSDSQAREHEREGSTNRIKKEGFGEGIVEGTECVRDVYSMVVGVHVTFVRPIVSVWDSKAGRRGRRRRLTIHPLIRMHSPMPKVLPAITKEDSDAEATCGLEDPMDGFRGPDLPCCETAC